MKYKFDPILGAGRDGEVALADVAGAGTAAAQPVSAFATAAQGAKADAALPATADAIADVLETAPPADLARIRSSASVEPKRRSPVAILKQFSGAGTPLSPDYTMIWQHAALGAYFGYQLVYANWGGSPMTVNKSRSAGSPTNSNNGSALAWVSHTFGGAASGVIPAAAGAGNDIAPGYLMTDMVYVASVARTDFPAKKPLLQTRTYASAGGTALLLAPSDVVAYNADPVSDGRQYAGFVAGGDQTANYTSGIAPTEGAAAWMQPVGVKFLYASSALDIAVCGDSLSKGHLTTGGAHNWLAVCAKTLTASGLTVSPQTHSWTGQKHSASHAIARNLISLLRPSAICFYAWSPNDTVGSGGIQGLMNEDWARTVETYDMCLKAGITPVLCTSSPWVAMSDSDDAYRVAQNARVIALGASMNTPVIDVAAVTENPADRKRLRPEYDTGDGLHLNDAAHDAIGAAAAVVIGRHMR